MLRSHTCGELSKKEIGKKVQLCGWNNSRRDHGGVIFIDLRDRYGMTQVVFDPSFDREAHKIAEKLSSEDCIQISGIVKPRKEGMVNNKMKTGEIEVFVDKIEILGKAETLPIEVNDRVQVNEDVRLKYRYLDLRRPGVQKKLILRHKAASAAREFLNSQGFLEIETPLLIKHTPEGARDYVVPSRLHNGKFYSLPQSPQLYKQILMVSGFDKYYQFARCLRDEDLRTDRQPEFTQIDVEMSFVEEDDIYRLGDELMKHIFQLAGIKIKIPFPRLKYEDVMEDYGTDKPDLRIPLKLKTVTELAKRSGFTVFENAAKEGIVKCLNVKGGCKLTRKDIDELTRFVQRFGAKGMAWIRVTKNQAESSIVKHFNKKVLAEIVKFVDGKEGDLLLFGAGKQSVVNESLSRLRVEVAQRLGMIKDEFKFCWIVDFPLFEYNEEMQQWQPKHHMFTMPKKEHLKFIESNPGKVKAQLYDLVLNGVELGSGSIRVHDTKIQEKIMRVVGYPIREAEKKFGFLLEAFKYGAPPHGGFALGFDRIVALICGINDIREVIAFPKTKSAESPMDNSPSEIDEDHLRELGLKIEAWEEVFNRLVGMLKTNNVEYNVMEHKAVYDSEEAAKVRGTKLEQVAKSLVYNAGHKYVMAVVSAAKSIDEKKLAKLVGVKDIKLATPREVYKLSGCTVGAVPPFGNLFGLETYVDSSFSKNKEIAFNAGSHTKSVIMKFKDYEKISGAKKEEFS